MKKNKLLSALVVGAITSAMAMGGSVYANTAIYIDGSSSGDDHYTSGVATNGGLQTYKYNGDPGEAYTYWVHEGGHSGDTLTMTGGSLDINGLSNGNDRINASGGTIRVNTGTLQVNTNSEIQADVNLFVYGGTLSIGGGTVALGSGDTVNGTISMSSGGLTINGATLGSGSAINTTGGTLNLSGTNAFNSNNSIAGAVINVTSGTQTFADASDIAGSNVWNKSNIVFESGAIDSNINNKDSVTGTTKINGTVQNNSTIDNNVVVQSGQLTNGATTGVINGTTTVNDDAAMVNSGTVDAVTNDGTFTNQGNATAGAITNNDTFTNKGEAVTGAVTNNGTFRNQGSAATGAITNNDKLYIEGGTVASVNNYAANTETTQSGGTVSGGVINKGTYTLSGTGIITNTVNNQGTFNLQNSGVSKYQQTITGATLNITNGGSLSLNVDGSDVLGYITDGTVSLGSTGTLRVNNGIDNTARVVTDGASVLNIQNGGLITKNIEAATTNIQQAAAVTIGHADTNGSITHKAGSLTLDGTNDVWNAKGTVTVNGGNLTLKGVTQNGTFSQISGATTIGASTAATAQTFTNNTTISGGDLNITEGDLIVNGANAVIGTGATINLASGRTLTVTKTKTAAATDGITIDDGDTWSGAISQGGGLLTLKDRSGAKADVTNTTGKTFTMDDGSLVLKDSSLTLNAGSYIKGGTVEIDPSTLIINNGESDNHTVLNMHDDGSVLTIQGADADHLTKFTLDDGSIIKDVARVTIGDSTNFLANELTMSGDTAGSSIAKEVIMTINKNAIVNMTGEKAELTINGTGANKDVWNGIINQTKGTLTILDDTGKGDDAYLNSDGGTINIGDAAATTATGKLTLNNANDDIDSDTVVNIKTDGTLAMSDGTVELLTTGTSAATDDTWDGAIALTGDGDLTLTGFDKTTTATNKYTQVGGTLTLDHTTLVLDTADSYIKYDTDNNESSIVNLAMASSLTFNNGLTDNSVELITSDTTANALSVTGNSALDLVGDTEINSEAAITVASGSKLDISSTDAATDGVIIDGTNDTWLGEVDLTGGKLTILGNNTKTSGLTVGSLKATTGTLNIGKYTDDDTHTDGTLNLNNTADAIASDVAVTVNKFSTLAQTAGNAVLDGTNDTWNGAITLAGTGNLELNGRDDVTTATKTYNQTAGTLTIDGDGSLTLATKDSKITDSSIVVLGKDETAPTDDTAGTLILSNGSANQAKVTTAGTRTSNALTVNGKIGDDATKLTLADGSDIEVGTVTVGDNEDGHHYANVLTMAGDTNGSKIAAAVTTVINKGATVNMTGSKADLTINTGDTWNGIIDQDEGTLTILNNVVKGDNAYLESTDGKIYIGNDDTAVADILTLNNANDKIAKATEVTIYKDGTLLMNKVGATVTINEDVTAPVSADTWNGAIQLDDGILTLDTVTAVTDATKKYNQNGGKATLTGTSLELATSASKITNGSVALTDTSTLTLSNGAANSAAVTMAAATETLNVTNGSAMTLDHYVYDEGGAGETLIKTAITAGAVNVGTAGTPTDHSVLEVSSGTIAKAANVAIQQGAAFNITGASSTDTAPAVATAITLDNTDVWNGDINLSNNSALVAGVHVADDTSISLTLDRVTQTTGANKTDGTETPVGTQPYYSQKGGSLYMTNGTTLTMADSEKISGGNVTIDATSVYNSLSNGFSVADLQTAGRINAINGGYENYAVGNEFRVGDGASDNKANFDIDLYARCDIDHNYKYDTFGKDTTPINATNNTDAVLHIEDWTLNGDLFGYDAPIDGHYNMSNIFKGRVNTTQDIQFTTTNKEVFTPIGWYGLHSAGNGNYTFDLNRYNPGVFRGQVATIAQYQNQLAIGGMLFDHTMLDQGFKGNDYIASNPNRLASATDLYPPYQYSRKDGGLWVKMYGTFEKLNMNHGLNVGNNAYGTIIGADFGLKELKHGWQFMPTAYIAYNGAHQYWQGYGNYQNGGQLGLMGTWYKNNFMIGALAYGGLYGNEMSTPRGHEDALGYFAGGSVKTAYNWRFAKDWSLQPNLLVAYNFFGKQNWHSDFGQMGMMSGMLHGINIAPGVNLIWEKETFSIYGTLQYMYNLNQSVGGRAGHVNLPNVHMDRGYIQYGLGVNKRFGDRFTGFLQCVIRNVGRTGVGLQAGFQWQLGKGSSKDAALKGETPKMKDAKVTLNGNKA